MQAPLPPILYKYFTASVGLTVLRTNRIRFTPPNQFNDPFDLNPGHDLSAATIQKAANKQARYQFAFSDVPKANAAEFLRQAEAHYIKEATNRAPKLGPLLPKAYQDGFSENFGVCCLTEHQSSHLMWAHYADEHRGCVLEFTIKDPHFIALRWLKKVTYAEDRPMCDYFSPPDKYLFTKSTQWSYEDEWRMYAHFKDLHTQASSGGEIHLGDLPSGSITGAYLGCRSSSSTVEEFKTAFREQRTKVKLFRMTQHLTKFQLIPEEIEV